MRSETRYAKSGDVHIAYQVIGNGPLDLVLVPQYVSHLELGWEEPSFARFLKRLSSFSRLIMFDKRGTGLSDRVSPAAIPTLEQRMDDVRAVMDAAGVGRVALFGICEGASMSALFAATHPDRTHALALYGTWRADARGVRPSEEEIQKRLAAIERRWGQATTLPRFAPSCADDEHFKRWWGRLERLGASPGAACALLRMNYDIDIADVLPAIQVPTLVLHRVGDLISPVAGGRYTAGKIPGAQYVELSGNDHLPWVGDQDTILGEVQEFLTGVRGAAELDRILATIMFTDIVGSTRHVAELGDQRWRDLVESHFAVIRRELAHHQGREIETAGDSVLAIFDGPTRAIRCARAVVEAVQRIGVAVRIGLHTGECEFTGEKVRGIAVHIGARIAALAGGSEVLVSTTVKDLVAGSGFSFDEHGVHVLQGVPGEWRLFRVK